MNHYLLLPLGPGLRPHLPQVLLLLPLHRPGLGERTRVRQAAARPARDRLRGARQRFPFGGRPAAPPGPLRPFLDRDRGGLRPEVAHAGSPRQIFEPHRSHGSPGWGGIETASPHASHAPTSTSFERAHPREPGGRALLRPPDPNSTWLASKAAIAAHSPDAFTKPHPFPRPTRRRSLPFAPRPRSGPFPSHRNAREDAKRVAPTGRSNASRSSRGVARSGEPAAPHEGRGNSSGRASFDRSGYDST